MTDTAYTRAHDLVVALNRLRKSSVRRKKSDGRKHFDRDREMARAIWHDANILGFGVGSKVKGDASDLCLVVFVRRKLAERRLRHLMKIPKYLGLHTLGTKVLTDIQEWGGPPVAHASVNSGVSIGDLAGNSGTMTLAVRDGEGVPLILGCSHVMARCGAGQPGDQIESPSDPNLDPNLNAVAKLVRFTAIDPKATDNQVDAAVAQPKAGVQLSNDVPQIGPISGTRDLTVESASVVGMRVQKFGAATKLQTGRITNIHVSTSIVYHQIAGDPSVDFTELVEYDSLSQEGDSGAAVLDTANSPLVVGMHIGGRSDGTASLFTHIQYVFEAMSVGL